MKHHQYHLRISQVPKTDNPISQSATDGMIAGMITGILMRHMWKFFGKLTQRIKRNEIQTNNSSLKKLYAQTLYLILKNALINLKPQSF